MKAYLDLHILSLAACLLASASTLSIQGQDPLNSWARRPVPGSSADLGSVAFGNGTFVAVGEASTVVVSQDGVNWTVGTAGAHGNLARVRFLNGQFVAVGASDKILFSPDGVAWTAATLPAADCGDVAYGNGVYVVAGSATFVSRDGASWSVSRGASDSVAFGNGRFVALPSGAGIMPKRTAYSINGVDWVETDAPTGFSAVGRGEVIFGGGVFVAEASQWSGVFASADGTAWCCGFRGQLGVPTVNGGLAHGQGHFVWAGYGSPDPWKFPFIYSSTDGSSWEPRLAPSSNPALNDPNLFGIARGAAFGLGTFVLVGDRAYIVQSGNLGGAPTIAVEPQDRGAIADNPVSFGVRASGSPILSFQWFHNGKPIPDATNSTLRIERATALDSGGYHVVISNSLGSATSRIARLDVAFLDIAAYAGIRILGVVGRTYRIEATPLNGPLNWQTITSIALPSSPYLWIDYESPKTGQRLYRVAELP